MIYRINKDISIEILLDHDRSLPGGIKVYHSSNTKSPLAVEVVARLAGIRLPVEKYFSTVHPGTWWTPYIVLLGCTYLSVKVEGDDRDHWITIPPSNVPSPVQQKVVCLGMNKSGTTSFNRSLSTLGYRFIDYFTESFIAHEVLHGSTASLHEVLRNPRYTGYEDVPFSLPGVGQKVVEAFPDYKYVLTVRESPEKWVSSVLRFYASRSEFEEHSGTDWYVIKEKDGTPNRKSLFPGGHFHSFSQAFGPIIHGDQDLLKYSWGIDLSKRPLESSLMEIYLSHNIRTEEMLKSKGVDYMVVDVSKPGEFKRVSAWLGHETEQLDFLWENRT